MSFFKKITSGVGKAVKAVVKDAVPIAAAVATGGTSLAVLKPENTLGRLDKLTGLPTSQLASMYGPLGAINSMNSGGSQPSQETVSPTALTQPQQGQSVYDMLTPYLSSFMQASQTKSSADVQPIQSNASYLAPQPQQSSGGSSKILLIVGGVVALAVGAFFIFRRK